MKNKSLLGKKKELFYEDVSDKEMRVQTNKKSKQNEIKNQQKI